MKPIVSVIIPTFNRNYSLKEAVESVLAQTFKDLELIIVDDGSSEPIPAFPAEKPSITYIKQQNKGPSSARNLGIKASKGEFIAFLDSDDIWKPQKLERQIEFFKDNPRASICQTEEIWIRRGRRVNPMKKHKKYGGMIFEKCLPLCIVSPSATMLRKSLLDEVGLFDETLPACEDYDLWLRIASKHPIHLIDEPLIEKRGGHEDQLSRNISMLDRYRIQSLKKILARGMLTEKQSRQAYKELKKKCEIYGKGCAKHGKPEEAEQILNLPKNIVLPNPRNLIIDKTLGDDLNAENIKTVLKPRKTRKISVAREKYEEKTLSEAKNSLLLTKNTQKFLKPCPGTNNHICCGYQILHLITGCNLDCSYCILQQYLGQRPTTVFMNIDDAINEIERFLSVNKNKRYRIGTGELTDSLSLDYINRFSVKLIPFFEEKENAILELKTKSANIKNLLDIPNRGRTIVSWSLNSKSVWINEEIGSSPQEKRIMAAAKCAEAGYRLGFHFDPIIRHPGWEVEYEETVDLLFKNISAEKIVWISMGCLRFMPSLKEIIEERFPLSKITASEFIQGRDGKMRYFKPERIKIYKTLLSFIRKRSHEVTVYLCMESPEVWERVFGKRLESNEDLAAMLDKAAFG